MTPPQQPDKHTTSSALTDCPQKPPDARHTEGHGAKTGAVRDRAILALLSETTISKAAKKSRVDEKTLRPWLSEDARFKAEYADANLRDGERRAERTMSACE